MHEKKRCVTVFFLLLAVLISVSLAVAETQVFSDEVISGESVEIDEFTFIITMNKWASAIFVDAGTMFQTIQREDCEDMENFEICFDNVTYDVDENEVYAVVRIFRSKPDVSITKSMNATELYVGQEAEVTITITNTGDTASQIIMTDDYPAGVEIYDLEGGCREHENQVYWQGHLDEDEEKECNFIIKPTRELHQSFVAHLKYWDGFKWIDEYSAQMTVDVEPVITLYSSIVREEYEIDGRTFDFEDENPGIHIGETARLIINITNEYGERITVNALDIRLPPDLVYKSIGHLRFNFQNASGDRTSIVWSSDRVSKINNQLLQWDGRINARDSKLFIIKLEAKRSGHQNVIVNLDYEYDDYTFEKIEYEAFEVSDPGVAVRMTIDDESKLFSIPERLDEEEDSIDLEALHPYRVTVYTQNINKYSELEDVDVTVYTELAGFPPVHYSSIEEEGQKIPYSLVLIPPQIGANKEFKMNVSIGFKNEFGERHYNSTEFKITVNPAKDLTIDIDSEEGFVLEGNEETEIRVSVNNKRLVDLRNVQVKDVIDPALHVEGAHSKKLKLNREEDTDVYSYRLIPPIVRNKTRYNITTTVSFFDPDLKQNIDYIKTTLITVIPLKPDISVDVNLDEPDDIYPGTLIPVEYVIGNDEEEEIVRDITVYFPIQEEVDFIGPKTYHIDKLDPGEEVTIQDVVKLRPKIVRKSLKLNKTRVEYYDNYGNLFDENETGDNIEVLSGLINGPAVFLRTVVPELINKSAETAVKIEIKNNGSDAASVTVEQGEKSWDVYVDAGKTEIIEYKVKYDAEGNYTIPDPIAKLDFQGLEAYTKGRGADVRVEMMLGAAEVEEEVEIVEVEEEIVEPEKEEMSFEEYEALESAKLKKRITRYALIGLVAVIILLAVVAFMYYEKKKRPAQPFLK
ncbi:DUF11 domain-containing protein [Candidatus Woesearchaeota archaeon]|nr:DUF11 domain-containing protein [Candidatus Woesearchaeota archaeon]